MLEPRASRSRTDDYRAERTLRGASDAVIDADHCCLPWSAIDRSLANPTANELAGLITKLHANPAIHPEL
jgi:hypothetical protein